MSFSLDAKSEVALNELPKSKPCQIAMLSGILRTAGMLSLNLGHYVLQVSTEIEGLCSVIENLIKDIYGVKNVLTIQKEEKQNHLVRYTITIAPEVGDMILYDCYILKKNYNGDTEIVKGISKYVVADIESEKSFVVGAFLGCASANIVIKDINNLKKHAGGYHLEFVLFLCRKT